MSAEHDPTTVHLRDCIVANVQRLADSVAGLDETALRRPVVPSGWTMLGLLGHVHEPIDGGVWDLSTDSVKATAP